MTRGEEPEDAAEGILERLTAIEARLEKVGEDVQGLCHVVGAQIDMQVESSELMGRLIGRLTGRLEELERLLAPPGVETG